MADKGGISTRKAWLIILASLIDDAAVLVLIFLVLWFFHVKITWPIILAAVLFIGIFIIIMHQAVIPALRRKKVTGSEGMVGLTGKVVKALSPEGEIKIEGEYWQAESVNGDAAVGEAVEVLKVDGIKLEVKRKDTHE
jgi:membrane protein implicated in regulation of membrane protease activity